MRHHFKNMKIGQMGMDLVVMIYKGKQYKKVNEVISELEKMIIGFINKLNTTSKI